MPGDTTERAVIYVRDNGDPDDVRRRVDECLGHAGRRGYQVQRMVIDPDGRHWPEMHDIGVRREAEVLVIPSRSELPKDRVPRIECVDEQPDRPRRRRRRGRFRRS